MSVHIPNGFYVAWDTMICESDIFSSHDTGRRCGKGSEIRYYTVLKTNVDFDNEQTNKIFGNLFVNRYDP